MSDKVAKKVKKMQKDISEVCEIGRKYMEENTTLKAKNKALEERVAEFEEFTEDLYLTLSSMAIKGGAEYGGEAHYIYEYVSHNRPIPKLNKTKEG